MDFKIPLVIHVLRRFLALFLLSLCSGNAVLSVDLISATRLHKAFSGLSKASGALKTFCNESVRELINLDLPEIL